MEKLLSSLLGLLSLLLGSLLDLSVRLDELKRVGDAQVAGQSVLSNDSLDLLNVHLVLLSHLRVLVSDLLLGNGDVLEVRDLLESQTGLDLALSLSLEHCAECAHLGAGHLEVLLKAHALHLEAVAEVLNDGVDLGLDHRLRDVSLHALENNVEQLLLECSVCCFLTLVLQALGDLLLEVVEGLAGVGNVLCELVVDSREDGLLDLVYLALEGSFLAGQLLSVVLLREGYDYVLLVALQPISWSSKPGMNAPEPRVSS